MNINHGSLFSNSTSLHSDLGGLNLIGEDLSAPPKSEKIDKNSILALYANTNSTNSNNNNNNLMNLNNSSFQQKLLSSSQFKNPAFTTPSSSQLGVQSNAFNASHNNHNNNFGSFNMSTSSSQIPQATNSLNQFQMAQITPQSFQGTNKNINQFNVTKMKIFFFLFFFSFLNESFIKQQQKRFKIVTIQCFRIQCSRKISQQQPRTMELIC